MADLRGLLETLGSHGVECILIGGVAARIHGSSRLTHDLDVVYSRSPENIARLVKALAGCEPYLRGAPPGLPFRFDERTIKAGLNFTLVTTLGDLDLLGVAGARRPCGACRRAWDRVSLRRSRYSHPPQACRGPTTRPRSHRRARGDPGRAGAGRLSGRGPAAPPPGPSAKDFFSVCEPMSLRSRCPPGDVDERRTCVCVSLRRAWVACAPAATRRGSTCPGHGPRAAGR